MVWTRLHTIWESSSIFCSFCNWFFVFCSPFTELLMSYGIMVDAICYWIIEISFNLLPNTYNFLCKESKSIVSVLKDIKRCSWITSTLRANWLFNSFLSKNYWKALWTFSYFSNFWIVFSSTARSINFVWCLLKFSKLLCCSFKILNNLSSYVLNSA